VTTEDTTKHLAGCP